MVFKDMFRKESKLSETHAYEVMIAGVSELDASLAKYESDPVSNPPVPDTAEIAREHAVFAIEVYDLGEWTMFAQCFEHWLECIAIADQETDAWY